MKYSRSKKLNLVLKLRFDRECGEFCHNHIPKSSNFEMHEVIHLNPGMLIDESVNYALEQGSESYRSSSSGRHSVALRGLTQGP